MMNRIRTCLCATLWDIALFPLLAPVCLAPRALVHLSSPLPSSPPPMPARRRGIRWSTRHEDGDFSDHGGIPMMPCHTVPRHCHAVARPSLALCRIPLSHVCKVGIGVALAVAKGERGGGSLLIRIAQQHRSDRAEQSDGASGNTLPPPAARTFPAAGISHAAKRCKSRRDCLGSWRESRGGRPQHRSTIRNPATATTVNT
ncbi:hypothetical protein GGS23DRAFT_147703 [Durotheca rogersii]|uniref:uncharacterized protein n=1 Tax=Durotheca rogersii TaxID=419775 RepID=UPI00222075E7|nr:uncharacterized protein GGS23DRAFT_147703 [Durotheca rogersii]KAI5861352.1 hypothetical protein GGS23DRAFT_147703 [Durotheca rogersii]